MRGAACSPPATSFKPRPDPTGINSGTIVPRRPGVQHCASSRGTHFVWQRTPRDELAPWLFSCSQGKIWQAAPGVVEQRTHGSAWGSRRREPPRQSCPCRLRAKVRTRGAPTWRCCMKSSKAWSSWVGRNARRHGAGSIMHWPWAGRGAGPQRERR